VEKVNKMNLNETLIALRAGNCNLIYQKMNGDIRVAVGTLNLNLVPKENWPKISTQEPNKENELIHYYDQTINGWRCFWMENLKSLSLV